MKATQIISSSCLLLFLLGCSTLAQTIFHNPILDEAVHDPKVIKHRDSYYMTINQGDSIHLLKSPILSNFRNAERVEIYREETRGANLYISNIQLISGDLYIYFTKLTDPIDYRSRRVFAIKCEDPMNPLGAWSSPTRILPEEEIYSLHGTVLQYNNGDLYFISAGGNPSDETASINLYISRMENPLEAVAPRTLLRTPTSDWERHTSPVNEAPMVIQNKGRTVLVFSASSVASPDYCLGVMGIDGGSDPVLASNWWNDVDHCVFARNDVEGVWAPGHTSFVRSPDDSEIWMMYDAWDNVNLNSNRTVRIQKIDWKINNPRFPQAMGLDKELEVPSGE